MRYLTTWTVFGQSKILCPISLQALVCASTLCKTTPMIGQLLVECEMDTSLFAVLYHTSSEDLAFDSPSPEHSMCVMLYIVTVCAVTYYYYIYAVIHMYICV